MKWHFFYKIIRKYVYIEAAIIEIKLFIKNENIPDGKMRNQFFEFFNKISL
jgi:hypothetical protein